MSRATGLVYSPLNWPETNLTLFSFLLHFPWEMLQLPLFVVPSPLTGAEAASHCARAALGDVVITLAAFAGASLVVGTRHWIRRMDCRPTVVFLIIGLGITIVFEYLATGPLNRWAYASLMPVVPLLEVGLAPLLQWLLIPPTLLWIVRRQLRGAVTTGSA